MYKVIIVDDEPIIRRGLCSMVKWEDYNCCVCASAADGEEAEQLILEHRPDIIFTDIKMQKMDGLQMVRAVRDAVPDCKIIVITGYREFDYAKEAISMGVFEFLLKPMEIEKILEVLSRAVEKLDQERQLKQKVAQYQAELDLSRSAFLERTLYEILYGILEGKDNIAKRLSICEVEDQPCVLVIAESDAEDGGLLELYRYDLPKRIGAMQKQEIPAVVSLDRWHIALLYRTEKEQYAKICDSVASLQEYLQQELNLTVDVGISSVGDGLSELPRLRKECENALAQKQYIGSGALIRAEDAEMFFAYQDFVALDQLRESLLEALSEAKEEEMEAAAAAIGQYIQSRKMEMSGNLRDYYWSILSALRKIAVSLQNDGFSVDLHTMVYHCREISKLQKYLEDESHKTLKLIQEYHYNNAGVRIQAIKKYISENYSKNITLTDVGEVLYSSPYYISRIFKQETGMNLIDYINEVRITQAKELLKDPHYKVYEVAEMVGVPDSHYFSRLFKKMTGLSPKEYRAGC